MGSIQRRIVFYQMFNASEGASPLAEMDFRPALRQVDRLSWENGDRYVTQEDGNDTCVWPDKVDAYPLHLRLAIIRREGLPDVESRGTMSALELQENQGLAEVIHLVLFRHNVVGADFNFHGPRVPRLGWYLKSKLAEGVPTLDFSVILRRNALRQLEGWTRLTGLHVKVAKPYSEVQREANRGLFPGLDAILESAGVQAAELYLKADIRQGGSLGKGFLKDVLGLGKRDDLVNDFKILKVEGCSERSEGIDTIDLLHSQVIEYKSIELRSQRFQALVTASAYAAIEDAYRQHQSEIMDAIGVAD